MKPRDLFDLVLLAMLWGGSFLFMRMTAPVFGPVALIACRVGIAALFLLPLLALRGGLADLGRHAWPLFVVGVTNSALPFVLFAYATLSITAGMAAVLNSTAPLFAAAIGWLWLRERLRAPQVLGLAVGLAGVVALVWDRLSFAPGGAATAVAAALAASTSYGFAASYTRRRLAGVPSLAVATGSQVAAALVLAPLALAVPPAQTPDAHAWAGVAVLGVACTGFAYILFFRLLTRVGPARAISVTFLVPMFGVGWGALFLGEAVTPRMLLGGAIVLAGTALVTGVLAGPRPAAAGQRKPARS